MKKIINIIAAIAISTSVMADPAAECYVGTTKLYPEPNNIIGWSPIYPMTFPTSGGVTALIRYASMSTMQAIVNVRGVTNRVPFSVNTTNLWSFNIDKIEASVTIPWKLMCSKPGNWAQVQVWLVEPGKAIADANVYAYAKATIQGN